MAAATLTREAMVDRILAQSEWLPQRQWEYGSDETPENAGTRQAMRFVAAQHFLISWQRGKVPVSWRRPRKIADFTDLYGADVVREAEREIDTRKREQREYESNRIALNAVHRSRSSAMPHTGGAGAAAPAQQQQQQDPVGEDPTDAVEDRIQADVRKKLHMSVRKKFVPTTIPMPLYRGLSGYDNAADADAEDDDAPQPRAGAVAYTRQATAPAAQPSTTSSGRPTPSPTPAKPTPATTTTAATTRATNSTQSVVGKSKAWILAMQKKEEEAKSREEAAKDRERQDKERELAIQKKLDEERARRMDRANTRRGGASGASGSLPAVSGTLSSGSGSVAGSGPLASRERRTEPDQRAEDDEDRLPESQPSWAVNLRKQESEGVAAVVDPANKENTRVEENDDSKPSWMKMVRDRAMSVETKRAPETETNAQLSRIPNPGLERGGTVPVVTKKTTASRSADDEEPSWMKMVKERGLGQSKESEDEPSAEDKVCDTVPADETPRPDSHAPEAAEETAKPSWMSAVQRRYTEDFPKDEPKTSDSGSEWIKKDKVSEPVVNEHTTEPVSSKVADGSGAPTRPKWEAALKSHTPVETAGMEEQKTSDADRVTEPVATDEVSRRASGAADQSGETTKPSWMNTLKNRYPSDSRKDEVNTSESEPEWMKLAKERKSSSERRAGTSASGEDCGQPEWVKRAQALKSGDNLAKPNDPASQSVRRASESVSRTVSKQEEPRAVAPWASLMMKSSGDTTTSTEAKEVGPSPQQRTSSTQSDSDSVKPSPWANALKKTQSGSSDRPSGVEERRSSISKPPVPSEDTKSGAVRSVSPEKRNSKASEARPDSVNRDGDSSWGTFATARQSATEPECAVPATAGSDSTSIEDEIVEVESVHEPHWFNPGSTTKECESEDAGRDVLAMRRELQGLISRMEDCLGEAKLRLDDISRRCEAFEPMQS